VNYDIIKKLSRTIDILLICNSPVDIHYNCNFLKLGFTQLNPSISLPDMVMVGAALSR
jgi:hypothetical protein